MLIRSRGDEHGRHDLAPGLVGNAENGGGVDARTVFQHALDLGWVDVLTAADDQVCTPRVQMKAAR